MSQDDGIDIVEGDPLAEDFQLYQEGVVHRDDEITFDLHEEGDNEGIDDGEGHPDDDSKVDWKQRYTDLQSTYDKSQLELKEHQNRGADVDQKFIKFGGIDSALQALEFVTTDKDFLDVANKKKEGRPIDGIDETKMSPEGKQALNTVRQIVGAEVSALKGEISSLKEVITKNIAPATNAIKDVNIDHHIEKMTEKHGNVWMKQLDSMQGLKDTISNQAKVAPTFDDLESLYFESLRRDGKMDDFAMSRAKLLSKQKTTKTTTRPTSTTGGETQMKTDDKKKGEKIDMFEAARRAMVKQDNQ